MNWIDRLKDARDKNDMRAIRLAERLGISSSAMTQWENSKTKVPRADLLLKAARILRVSPYWIMFGEDEEILPEEIIQIAKAFTKLDASQQALISQMIAQMLKTDLPVDIQPEKKRLIEQKELPIKKNIALNNKKISN